MKISQIKRTAEISGVIAAVMVYIIAPAEGKAVTLCLTGTAAFLTWVFTIGFLAALNDIRIDRRAARRERKLYSIEISKEGRRRTWKQVR